MDSGGEGQSSGERKRRGGGGGGRAHRDGETSGGGTLPAAPPPWVPVGVAPSFEFSPGRLEGLPATGGALCVFSRLFFLYNKTENSWAL